MRHLVLFATLSLTAATLDAQQPAPSVAIPRLDARVTVDGRLDEPVWKEAALLDGFHQYQPSDSRPAQERTEVLVWYAPDALMVGIRAFTADVASLRATRADRDKIDNDDRVVLYLDTFNDRRRAFMFGVNALGVQLDGVRTEGASSATSMFGGSIDYNPDFYYESRGRLTAQGYEVELRIPFKSLRLPGTGEQVWGFNVHRFSPSSGYEDTWTDVRRAGASFLAQAGTLTGLHDLERGVVTEVQPFVTGAMAGAKDATGRFTREPAVVTAGANVRLGFTQLSLDATFNPDFSQVESDAGLVTLNERFALYIPEKRPFFLEGIELFATPNQLVYTRQLMDPSVGGKVTGKLGAYSVAMLSALDHEAAGNAQFEVARVRRDLGAESNAGLTVTDKERGGGYNRVAAADVRWVYGKLYYFEGQLGGASTRDDASGATRDGAIWKLENDRTGRHWGYNIQWVDIGRDFQSQAGFVPRTDVTTWHWFNRFSWYGAPGARLESITTFFGPSRVWRSGGAAARAPLEGSDNVTLMMRLRGGWNITSEVGSQFYHVPSAGDVRYPKYGASAPTPWVPASVQNGLIDAKVEVATPVLQRVNATLQVQRTEAPIFAEGSRGTDLRLSGSLLLRPSAATRVEATLATSRITRERDGSRFAQAVIPRVKCEYQLNRATFVRLVGEYRSEERDALRDGAGAKLYVGGAESTALASSRLRLDWLVSYQPTPGTVAFLGYGSGMDAPRAAEVSELRRSDDAIFVKLAYQFRR